MYAIKNKLLLLLLIQIIACIAVIAYQIRQEAAGNQQNSLFGTSVYALDTLALSDGSQHLLLKKKGSHWQFDVNNETLPVDDGKITAFLDKLKAMNVSWPVATTADAKARFEVAAGQFKRKLVLKGGDGEKTLYLGTTPSYQKVHLRKDGDDNIYAVALGINDASVEAVDWLDKNLLGVKEMVRSIKSAQWQLADASNTWQLQNADGSAIDAAQKTEESAAAAYIDSWRTFTVEGIIADTTPFKTMQPVVSINIRAGGKDWQYRYFKQDTKHVVQRNNEGNFYQISEVTAKNLFEKTMADFIAK